MSANEAKEPVKGSKPMCRNIVSHGSCPFEGKGCLFDHPPREGTPVTSAAAAAPSPSKPTPTTKTKFSAVQAAEFVPSGQAFSYEAFEDSNISGYENYGDPQEYNDYNPYYNEMESATAYMGQMSVNETGQSGMGHAAQLDAYFYQQQQQAPTMMPREPLQYHMYTTPLPHVSQAKGNKTIHTFFMSDTLREELTRRNEEIQRIPDPLHPEFSKTPAELSVYNTICPIESGIEPPSKVFGCKTASYKATSSVDGKPYYIRRIEEFRLTDESAIHAIEAWRRIKHCNIVGLKEAFTNKAFGDDSLFFSYDYHPLSQTLFEKYFARSTSGGVWGQGVPEATLWSFITQITSALRQIHSMSLAARVVDPSKIILTGKNRIRLTCCGISDVLSWDGRKNVLQHQQEDLLNFGQLIVALGTGTLMSTHNLPKALELVSRQYSPDVKNVVMYLLSKPSSFKNVDELLGIMGPRILHEINNAHLYNDCLEEELAKELENGRLVRLLCKLGFINERPEFDMNPEWAETGDRYLLKLFRDYVFHQVNENGAPLIEMAHVVQCLNKLDVGIDEKIMLMSRDEQSCLIVSFRELKQCMDATFRELVKRREQY